MEQNTKKCPYCGEEIMVTAKKCRHCGKWLNDFEKVTDQKSGQHTLGAPETQRKNNAFKYIGIGVAILAVIVGIVLAVNSNSGFGFKRGESPYNQDDHVDSVLIEEAEEEPIYEDPIAPTDADEPEPNNYETTTNQTDYSDFE